MRFLFSVLLAGVLLGGAVWAEHAYKQSQQNHLQAFQRQQEEAHLASKVENDRLAVKNAELNVEIEREQNRSPNTAAVAAARLELHADESAMEDMRNLDQLLARAP